MALPDIIARIEADAAAEVAALMDAAEARAAAIRADADKRAAAHADEVLTAAEREAVRAAETIVVNARLAARDRAVAARRVLVAQALTLAAGKLAELPDAEYAAFLGARVANVARGGETLAVGSADSARRDAIVAAARAADPALDLNVSDEPAPFERGVLLTGDRVRADLSLDAIVSESRDDLELAVVRALSGSEA